MNPIVEAERNGSFYIKYTSLDKETGKLRLSIDGIWIGQNYGIKKMIEVGMYWL